MNGVREGGYSIKGEWKNNLDEVVLGDILVCRLELLDFVY